MAVAASMYADNGFFAQNGGYEYPAMLGLTAAALALGGPGQLSLDAALNHRALPWMRLVGLVGVSAAAALVVRRRKAALQTDGPGSTSSGSTSSELATSTDPAW